MTRAKIESLKEKVDEKFAKYVQVVENGEDMGISTAKGQYIAALEEWEEAWHEFLKAESDQ